MAQGVFHEAPKHPELGFSRDCVLVESGSRDAHTARKMKTATFCQKGLGR